MLYPVTLLIVGLLGGLGATGSFATYHYAQKAGSKLTLKDLRPALPHEGFPFPIFFYTKPEVLAELRRK